MSKIITYKTVNKSNETDNEELVICSKWDDSKIKLLIKKSDNTLLIGEAFLEDFKKYAKTFDKTLELYLEEMQDILSGNHNDIEFHLKNNKFYWKRKTWSLGQIIVSSVLDPECLTDFTIFFIQDYAKIKMNVSELKKDNDNLQSLNSLLTERLDKMVEIKLQMENDLYKRYILLLNSKKAKIKELMNRLEKYESIFDLSTDETSDDSIDSKSDLASHIGIKRKFNGDDNKNQKKKRKLKSDCDVETSSDEEENKINKVIDTKLMKTKISKTNVLSKEKDIEFQEDFKPIFSTIKEKEPIPLTSKVNEPAPLTSKVNESFSITGKVNELFSITDKVNESFSITGKVNEPAPLTNKVNEPVLLTCKVNESVPLIGEVNEPVPLTSTVNEPVLLTSNVNEPVLLTINVNEPVPLTSKVNEPVLLTSNVNEPVPLIGTVNESIFLTSNVNEPVASTSKVNESFNLEEDEETPDFLDESDNDYNFELKYDEDKSESDSEIKSAKSEEDSKKTSQPIEEDEGNDSEEMF